MSGVTEFVIMCGPDVHDYLVSIRTQLRRHLRGLFPNFRFSLATHPAEGMGFVVVPMLGTVGDGRVFSPLKPDELVMSEIREALEDFQPAPAETVH